MGFLGVGELIIIILVVILVIFGPKRLPEMGRSLGLGIREFKSAGKEIRNVRDEVVEAVNGNDHDLTTQNRK